MDVQEVKKLDAYLKKLFGNPRIRVVPRPKKDDSAEVYVGEEFIGVLFVDDEDDERSYNFQMAILGTDLELTYPPRSRYSAGCNCATSRSKPAATLRQSRSHSRGNRSVISAASSTRSWMQVPGTVANRARAAGEKLLGLVGEITGLRPHRACRRGTAGWQARPGRRVACAST